MLRVRLSSRNPINQIRDDLRSPLELNELVRVLMFAQELDICLSVDDPIRESIKDVPHPASQGPR